MKLTLSLCLQIAASILTIIGAYVGTTTIEGSSIYLFSVVFWYWLCIKEELWGLMPLNIAMTFVSLHNLFVALHK